MRVTVTNRRSITVDGKEYQRGEAFELDDDLIRHHHEHGVRFGPVRKDQTKRLERATTEEPTTPQE